MWAKIRKFFTGVGETIAAINWGLLFFCALIGFYTSGNNCYATDDSGYGDDPLYGSSSSYDCEDYSWKATGTKTIGLYIFGYLAHFAITENNKRMKEK